MKEKLIYILPLFLFLSCDFTSSGEYYNRALNLSKQEEYSKAIILLDKAIEKQPKFRPALLNRGVYKSELGNFKEGIKDYNKVLEYDSDNTFALFNIANNYSHINDHIKAIIYYSKALKTEGALKSFASADGAMAINPNLDLKAFDSDMNYCMLDCEIYFERGIEYLKIEEYDKAVLDFTKSLKSDNAVKDCYFLLGKAFIGKKDAINACNNFMKSAKLGDEEAKEMLKKHCDKTSSNEDSFLITQAENLLIKEFKLRLNIAHYDLVLREVEKYWIAKKVLEKKDENGYLNLLKTVAKNGFSEELVSGIYKAKANNLKLHEFRFIFEENKITLDALPKSSSLFRVNQLVKGLTNSTGNITSISITKSLLDGIQPYDLDKEFYQNIIIFFYSSII